MPIRLLSTVLCLAALSGAPAEDRTPSASTEPTTAQSLSLDEAIARALETNPGLAAFDWELRASDARILQAGLRPNPELSIELEDIALGGGSGSTAAGNEISGALFPTPTLPAVGWNREHESGDRSAFEELELTLSIAQVIERGQKRVNRVALAQSEKDLVQWDYEVARADLIAAVARTFVDVLAAQENVRLQEELLTLAQDVSRTIDARIQAGKVSPLEGNKARIALANTELDMEMARSTLEGARTLLASTWGGTASDVGEVIGELHTVSSLPSPDVLQQRLEANPDLARWASELVRRDAELALARSERKVDPTIVFGLRATGREDGSSSRGYGLASDGSYFANRSRGSNDGGADWSVLLGVSVPLPLFNRNQGRIAEAEALIEKSAFERHQAMLDAMTALSTGWTYADGAFRALQKLDADVLPQAQETLDKTRRGYTEGKFAYLDVLDAQRTLFDARTSYLDRLAEFHRGRVAIERLTGGSFSAENEMVESESNTIEGDSHDKL